MEDRLTKRRYSVAFYLLIGWIMTFLSWWYFALAPLPSADSEWIAVARRICFGAMPTGLPEGYGWVTLVLTPLAMLAGIIVIWPKALWEDLLQAFRGPVSRVLTSGLFIALFVSVAWGLNRVHDLESAYQQVTAPNFDPEGLPAEYPRYAGETPSFNLVDQNGETVTLDSLRGEPFILTFAFAHCTTVCPGLVTTLATAADTYKGERPAVVIISLDPWRDTPSALPGLHKLWTLSSKDRVLSGDVDDVLATIDAYGIDAIRDMKTGDITHPNTAFIFSSQGELMYQLTDPSLGRIHGALAVVDE